MQVDYLIVGAGFTGAVLAERIASELGKKVLVVERRNHIGGNAYDEFNSYGILIHRYGPHIFHTNSKKIFDYLSRFTEWRPYYHRVLAMVEGKEIPLPFSLASLRSLFSERLANKLEGKLITHYGYGARVPILRLREDKDKDLRFLADYVYKHVFEGYTLKQWGMKPEELSSTVTERVPILVSYDECYFQDVYQVMPKEGYTALFRRILSHPNIKLLLGTDFKEVKGQVHFNRLIYTGPIDEFFEYLHGPLPYRSLRFEFVNLQKPWHQKVAQVNYPNEYEFTRIIEFKHLSGQTYLPHTTIAYEYPESYEPGRNQPYYPVPREENEERYQLYLKEAKKLKTVIFVGRLGDYRYYNMDQAVARALEVFEKEIAYERKSMRSRSNL
jgi:UDP-galactopyranose mutase